MTPPHRFIYQDVPIYDFEEFSRLAPEEATTIDEHELMKNRLEFEFAERTRHLEIVFEIVQPCS